MITPTDDQLQRMLILHEGMRGRPYQDTKGISTIGIGHNLAARPLTKEAQIFIYREDMLDVLRGLDRELPWWRSLAEPRQRALADMAFNMGVDGVRLFTRMLMALQREDYHGAATAAEASLWARQVGDGPNGRFDRADRIAQIFETGRDAVLA